MADHDRNDGSRGEEEAPRDPTPSRPDGVRLKYGEQADRADADIPAFPDPPGRLQEPSFGGHLRRKQSQIVAAGVVGLIAGALLGGVTVAALTDLRPDHLPNPMRMEPGLPPPPHRDFRLPERMPECLPAGGDSYCVIEGVAGMPGTN